MRFAIEHGYRYVINMDADFSHHPHYLPALLAGIGDCPDFCISKNGTVPFAARVGAAVDVMIGSRYVPGGGIEGWSWQRHAMSRGVNFLSRRLLGLPAPIAAGLFAAIARRSLPGSILPTFAAAAIRSRRRFSGG